MPHTSAETGDKFACIGPAGGGYGDPYERDTSLVLDDVLDELISIDTARNDYGVVISDTLQLDEQATADCRAARA